MPRLAKPRVAPLPEADWSDVQREIMRPFVGGSRTFNVFTTLLNHEQLFRRWLVFANHVLYKGTISPRDREILILRTGKLADCEYELRQHVLLARDCGLSDDEIAALLDDSKATEWPDKERALIVATDELMRDRHLGDRTWAKLRDYFDEPQIMDIIFTVGQYNMLAMALNSLGVQPDEGLPELP